MLASNITKQCLSLLLEFRMLRYSYLFKPAWGVFVFICVSICSCTQTSVFGFLILSSQKVSTYSLFVEIAAVQWRKTIQLIGWCFHNWLFWCLLQTISWNFNHRPNSFLVSGSVDSYLRGVRHWKEHAQWDFR